MRAQALPKDIPTDEATPSSTSTDASLLSADVSTIAQGALLKFLSAQALPKDTSTDEDTPSSTTTDASLLSADVSTIAQAVQCSELTTPNNGAMKCYDCNGKFSYKSTCEFACNEGYTIRTSSSSTLFCEATGQWNDTQPSCEIIKCKPEDIPRPDHSSVKCSGPNGNFSYDSVCEYSCEEGYELKGSNTTKCTATTKWTGKPPTCELVKCSPVEVNTLQHGSFQCSEPRGKYSYDSECVYLCNTGYELKGSNKRKCTATKQWTGTPPTCELIKCKPEDIPRPDHSSVKCSGPNGNYSYDSVCEYSCEEGYELKEPKTTKCTATTKWTVTPPTCERQCNHGRSKRDVKKLRRRYENIVTGLDITPADAGRVDFSTVG
ncbi:P-selectin-like [Misgurnus anguillicaudatus]|uniref:P-selectin-like n=1 Tax=Misgurnus anguillicaudatus TaxID=75329 RepID=UPI003CCF3C37